MTTDADATARFGSETARTPDPVRACRAFVRWSPAASVVVLAALLPPLLAGASPGEHVAARIGGAVVLLASAHLLIAVLEARREARRAGRPTSGSSARRSARWPGESGLATDRISAGFPGAGPGLLVLAWVGAVLVVVQPGRASGMDGPVVLVAEAIGIAGLLLASAPWFGIAALLLPVAILVPTASDPLLFALPTGALVAVLVALGRRWRFGATEGVPAADLAPALRADLMEADECLWSLGPDLRLHELHPTPATLTTEQRDALRRVDWRGWVHDGAQRRDEIGARFRRLRRAVLRRERFRRIELPLVLAGEDLFVSLTGWPVGGTRGGFRGIALDQTGVRASENLLRRATELDAVTGLANRSMLLHALRDALGQRAGATSTALVLVDLDGFSAINDEHGSTLGDALLQAVAGRLLAGVRDGDLVARVGADEFAVLCAGTGPQAAELARRLLARLGEPFALDGVSIHVGGNAGVACTGEAPVMSELLKSAELALGVAAASGRSGGAVRVFEPAMRDAARERHRLRIDLRDALARGELTLAFQPVIAVGTGRVIACEALARWTHAERGPIAPSVFIPLAEQSGLIGRLGDWALQAACQEAATWPDDARVAVNVSVIQLRNPGFGRSVDAALALSGLPAHRLELELTESVLLDDPGTTVATLHGLRERGLTIALDDFGTAYASLSTLLAFRFDRVKLDRSFVSAIDREPAALAITRSVFSLADGLGLPITAEGVERAEQLDTLRRLGCREAQGFLFSPPLSAAGTRALLATAMRDQRIARRGAAD